MPATPVEQFFTWGSLGTLAGATGATFAVTNSLSLAFDFSPKWLGLAVAQAVCIVAVAYIGKLRTDWPVAILNGCLVFLAAAGATGATNGVANAAMTKMPPIMNAPLVEVFRSWT
jgi:hypothetical protein